MKYIYFTFIFFSIIACNPKPKIQNEKTDQKLLDYYMNNEDYFIRNIDLNKDGVMDKIVSNEKYYGEELLLFIHHNEQYELVLKTTNLSQDGGLVIGDIFPENSNDDVFRIHTYFPDGGYFVADHYITYNNKNWTLDRTVYETNDWKEGDNIHVCTVNQGISLEALNKEEGQELVRYIPDEKDRDQLCNIK